MKNDETFFNWSNYKTTNQFSSFFSRSLSTDKGRPARPDQAGSTRRRRGRWFYEKNLPGLADLAG